MDFEDTYNSSIGLATPKTRKETQIESRKAHSAAAGRALQKIFHSSMFSQTRAPNWEQEISSAPSINLARS